MFGVWLQWLFVCFKFTKYKIFYSNIIDQNLSDCCSTTCAYSDWLTQVGVRSLSGIVTLFINGYVHLWFKLGYYRPMVDVITTFYLSSYSPSKNINVNKQSILSRYFCY